MLNQKTLRTPSMQKKYMEHLKNNYDGHCIYCNQENFITEWKYWSLSLNKFHYDRVYSKKHYMLAPKRHVASFYDLTQEELDEYREIREGGELKGQQLIENINGGKSIPEHWHVHIVTIK